jgi:uncharacterized damage-inducible protein DinB
MHPRTQELLDHLDSTRARLERSFQATPPAGREQRPGPDRWSIAEIVEHLVIVESRIFKMLDDSLTPERLRELGPDTETSPILATLDVARLVDRTNKIMSGETSLPKGGVASVDSWAQLQERRKELKAKLQEVDGYALGGVQFSHPRLGSMTLYQWVAFLGAHELRHAAQIDEVHAAGATGVAH